MTDWIKEIVQAAIYSFLKSIAQMTWGLDKAGLSVIELLDRLRRALVTEGFPTALAIVGAEVQDLNRPVFALALVCTLLLVILLPAVRLRWFDLRKVLLYGISIPLLVPMLVGSLQHLDAARSDLGGAFYDRIFLGTNFNLVPEGQPIGETRDMGPMVPYHPDGEQTGLHGVDVAAAYLFATRHDVVNPPESLPVAFRERYFRYSVEELANAPDAWAEIDRASEGITRTFYGVVIIAFAFLETVVNLGFTLSLGFLLVALILSMLFAFIAPFEAMLVSLVKNIATLMMQSWAVSAMQALTLSAVINVAENGNGTQVLGAGLVGLLLECMWVTLACRSVLSAIGGLSLGGSSGGDASAALRRVTGLARSGAGAVVDAGKGAATMGGAYVAAKRAGASTQYARAYAASSATPFAKLGGLAAAMGWMDPESDTGKGMYAGAVIGRGEPFSLRSAQALRRDVAQQQRPGAAGHPPPGGGIPPAPAVDVHAMSTAIAQVAATAGPQADAGSATPSMAVAQQLGVTPGAWGTKARAVDALVTTLQQHPLPAGVAQQLMLEATQEGGFRVPTRRHAAGLLTQVGGLPTAAATRHLESLEKQMKALPTSLRASDLAQPSVDQLMSTSPHSVAALPELAQGIPPIHGDDLPSVPMPPAAPPPPTRTQQAQREARQAWAQDVQSQPPGVTAQITTSPVLPRQRDYALGNRPVRPKRGKGRTP